MNKKIINAFKIFGLILVVPISVVLSFALLFLSAYLYNNLKTYTFYSSLKNIALPAKSEVVDGYKRFGLIWGNSSHCDVEIAIVVESKLNSNNFDKFLQNSSDSLAYPYESILTKQFYYELFTLDEDNNLIFINDGKEYIVRKSEYGNYYPARYNDEKEYEELHIFWENRDFDTMQSFMSNITKKEECNYFLIVARDQTFDGFPMNDLRCN
jgi:hypothetical protein